MVTTTVAAGIQSRTDSPVARHEAVRQRNIAGRHIRKRILLVKSKHDDVRREKIGMVVVGNFKLSGDRRQETAMTALLGGQRKAINIEGAFNSVGWGIDFDNSAKR